MSDKENPSLNNQHLVRMVRARIRQATGKQYPQLELQLEKLTAEAVLELGRLVADLEANVTRAKRQALHEPWRRG